MKRDPLVYIDDILDSIEAIKEYAGGLSREQLLDDFKTQDAIHRRLEIIGEAVNRLPPDLKEKYSEIPWNKIVGMRNVLAHEYEDVVFDVVWGVVENRLPVLEKQLRALLEKEESR